MIRKNMKLIIGFVIGLLITSAGVYAANSLSANSISISKTNMSKVPQENLQSALDYLYSQSEKNNLITIESGVLHKSQTYLGIVYLDPTNLDNKCTAQNSVSETGTKTGCMKWYIYKDLGDSYKMILDHNTTAQVAWNTVSDEQHPYGTNVTLEESNIKPLLTSLVNDSGWKITPDLISAEEVAEIVGQTGFTNTSAWFYLDSKNQTRTNTREGTSNYAWLFDNLGWRDWECTDYGCNVNNATGDNISAAYWTKTPRGTAGAGSYVWRVDRNGYLYHGNALDTSFGVRPVITVLKSNLS